MKHVGAPALTAAFAGILLGGIGVSGAAFLGFGIQVELARWMSDGVAAILAGVLLIAAPIALIIARTAPVKAELVSQDLPRLKPETASSLLTSNLSQLARTAFIGMSARRPIAMLAIATAFGAALLIMSETEKEVRPANGRGSV